MSRNCMSSLQGAEWATTPMPSWEDFACGRKPVGAMPPLPGRLLYEHRKATRRHVCTDPAHLRGRLASLQQMAIVLGLFGAFLSNDLLARLAGGASATFWLGAPAWRWLFWMEAVPAAALLLGALCIPESPRFLIASGKREQARRVFARIDSDADALVRQVEQSLRGEHRPHLADVIVSGPGRVAPVVLVGMGVAAFQQFVGINIIFYYGEVLWKAAGATEQWALRINLLTGIVYILATIPAIVLIDRAGRKPLLLAGSAGMALTLGVRPSSLPRPG